MEADTDLIRRALAVNYANLALGNDAFVADGATFVRNTRYPDIYDANHVAQITAASADEIDRLLARVEREFAHAAHRSFHLDFTTPPAVAARLTLMDYEPSAALVMLLEGDVIGRPEPFDIRPIADDDGWRAFAALRSEDWIEHRAHQSLAAAPAAGERMMRGKRDKTPPLRWWLGYIDGVEAGYLSSWEGTDGVGQVEDLFVRPAYRHRGLATALIHHCVADARAFGAGAVVIVADAADTPKQMYAALGFRPVAVKHHYLKRG